MRLNQMLEFNEAKTLLSNGYKITVITWNRKGVSVGLTAYKGIKIERVPLKVPSSNSKTILFPFLLGFNIRAFFKLFSLNFDSALQ